MPARPLPVPPASARGDTRIVRQPNHRNERTNPVLDVLALASKQIVQHVDNVALQARVDEGARARLGGKECRSPRNGGELRWMRGLSQLG